MKYNPNIESKEEGSRTNKESYMNNQGIDFYQSYAVNKMNKEYDSNTQKDQTNSPKKNSLILINLYNELKALKIGIGNMDV